MSRKPTPFRLRAPRAFYAWLAAALAAILPGAARAQVPQPTAPASPTPAGGDSVGTRWAYESDGMRFRAEVVARGLHVPWSLAFLPDGRMLVSERARGRVHLVDPPSGDLTPVAGVPNVYTKTEGTGMMELSLHPDYERNGWIYYSYSAQIDSGYTTVVERARLRGASFVDRERLFTVMPALAEGNNHFGGRLVLRDGFLFLSTGERNMPALAQDLTMHHGKVIRLHDDGRVPRDNPFVGRPGVRPEIWTYGNRNVQGLTLDPTTSELWSHEHGPRGGDEVNVLQGGRNYGWPVITFGQEYAGGPVGEGITHRDGMEQPAYFYVPSIAPSGLAFYSGSAFPRWRGNLFVGAMVAGHLNRLVLRDGRVVSEQRLLRDRNWRVRDVREGPDGFLYITVDQGMIVRLRPE